MRPVQRTEPSLELKCQVDVAHSSSSQLIENKLLKQKGKTQNPHPSEAMAETPRCTGRRSACSASPYREAGCLDCVSLDWDRSLRIRKNSRPVCLRCFQAWFRILSRASFTEPACIGSSANDQRNRILGCPFSDPLLGVIHFWWVKFGNPTTKPGKPQNQRGRLGTFKDRYTFMHVWSCNMFSS